MHDPTAPLWCQLFCVPDTSLHSPGESLGLGLVAEVSTVQALLVTGVRVAVSFLLPSNVAFLVA